MSYELFKIKFELTGVCSNELFHYLKLKTYITMAESIIQKKSFQFAIEIIKLYKQLVNDREFVLSKQLLRSGTSIGANASEAHFGQTPKDFVHKLHISRKEASESLYWLNLLQATDYISDHLHKKLSDDCSELLKILTSIIMTLEKKQSQKY